MIKAQIYGYGVPLPNGTHIECWGSPYSPREILSGVLGYNADGAVALTEACPLSLPQQCLSEHLGQPVHRTVDLGDTVEQLVYVGSELIEPAQQG